MSLQGNAAATELRGKINGLDVLTVDAYAIAVKNGFKGTEAEWLKSLQGHNGKDGVTVVTTEQASGERLCFWVGTQAEYDELPEKDSTCLYLISDDQTVDNLESNLTNHINDTAYQTATIAQHTSTIAQHTSTIAQHDDKIIAHNTEFAKQDMRIDELEANDYIVEQDSYTLTTPILGENQTLIHNDSIKWTWRKWNSGHVDLYGYHQVYSAIDQPVGPLYMSYEISPRYFPFNVYDATGFVDCHDYYVWCPSCIDRTIGISGEQIKYSLMCPREGAAKTWHVYIQVNGRWK